MTKDKFGVLEDEDGIVVFDESDDYVPGETIILDENDELDTEYLLRETARQEAQQTKAQQIQRWVSVGVITVVVAFIAGVCYMNFRYVF